MASYSSTWIVSTYCQAQIGCLSKQTTDGSHIADGHFDSLLADTDTPGIYRKKLDDKGNNKTRPKSPDVGKELWDDEDLSKWREDGLDLKSKPYGTMFSLQNCTLQSEDKGDGETYWVSFEEKSFSKGNEFKVYNGRMNGRGPKSGDKCVVKVFRQCQGTKSLCSCEVKKSLKAKELVRSFRELAPEQCQKLKMTTVYWALMDEVSKLKLLFFTGERKLSTREAVLFEDDVRVNDDKPGKLRKLTLYINSKGEKDELATADLEAFVHFTYHHTNGGLVICGLEGVHDEEGYFLKTPTIHSLTGEFGIKDRGMEGIKDVFSWHTCNDVCKGMILPSFHKDLVNGNEVPHGTCPVDPVLCPSNEPSNKSCCTEYSFISRMESRISQVTETFSDYLEPTAPALEDCDESVFQPSPPPYSQLFVANWLLGEQSQNCFIQPMQEEVTPPQNSNITGENRVQNLNEINRDHITRDLTSVEAESDIGGVSTMDSSEDMGTDKSSVQFDKKRVRFSVYNGTGSSHTPSTANTISSSDSPMDISTVTSTSGSQPRSIIRHRAESLNTNQIFFPHTIHPSSPQNRFEFTNLQNSEINQQIFTDSPPSYFDSEMATAYWIVQRGYIPVQSNANKGGNDNCDHNTIAAVITPNGQIANFFPVAVNNIQNQPNHPRN
ncbi:uncharacterized protein LOC131957443 isoform X2 [Physella acuta]|uniref:uncharacterized protein LOC131957443 isoform X2 n=1 Tax=Physella acuta TaxID=109671 RepID=UPI0027DAECE7|nr:uncharacterized protein LOC131957443 isoform X2 [Physella acuta]